MKFTLNWLKDHLETSAALDAIVFALTDLGMEVEAVENPAAKLEAFTICRVIEAKQHPNADRLRLCRVEVWLHGPNNPSQEIQVVCGAPNARGGMIGVFAPVGTHVPGTGVDLKSGVIRGVESNGMLCSERELMLSDNHDGIIDLPADAPLGMRFADYRGISDPVIEIKVTPNRPDALGIQGIARDLAARGIGTQKTRPTSAVPGQFASPVSVRLNADVAAKACPLFIGRTITGVRNGPSPQWLQDRLQAIGLRPISALVDVTNFLTYDRNRPLHVFDADKLSGDVEVRKARKGETLLALDDRQYEFDGSETLVTDASGPLAIGGVIGGLPTGCSGGTTNVFLEAAYFDPLTTAITGRKHKINSDARYRFERGIDPAFTAQGVELATQLILDLCGGTPSEIVIAGQVPDTARSFPLDSTRVSSLVGMDIAKSEQLRILTALGFTVSGAGDTPDVWVPSWRPDVLGQADLVEEIARVTSLAKLRGVPMRRRSDGISTQVLTPMQKRETTLRRQVAALGYNECVTYSFIDQRTAALFGGGTDAVMIGNPIASDMSHLRPDLLPGLLAAAARNQSRGFADLALFEIGPVFSGGEPADMASVLAGIRVGFAEERSPHGSRRAVDIFDVKADVEAALAGVGVAIGKLSLSRSVPDWFHPGRSAALTLGPRNVLAVFGEAHPNVLTRMDVKGPAVAFSLFPAAIPFAKTRNLARTALDASGFQAVERDFAFVVDARIEAAIVSKAAFAADKALIAEVNVFDVFEGAKTETQMGTGKKSVAIAVRLQPRYKTLTDAEIDGVAKAIVSSVCKATGGTLRG